MIISRTPFRISFAGGGSDLHSFYQFEYGAVLSVTINKHLYITVRRQNRLHNYRIRVSYSVTESVDRVDHIKHPIVREALNLLQIDEPIEIVSISDIPAKTGLGSSSSFAVGLLHALYAFKGQYVSAERLAREAAYIEIDVLKRPIGKQDHYAAAFGGLNFIRFFPNEEVLVEPVICRRSVIDEVFGGLMLFYTGMTRDAGGVLKEQSENTAANVDVLQAIRDQAIELKEVLENGDGLEEFARILHEGWTNKRKLAAGISNPIIDEYYETALKAGALGGKLLGAGGGGFLLLCVQPANQEAVRRALPGLIDLKFESEPYGSRIIFYD